MDKMLKYLLLLLLMFPVLAHSQNSITGIVTDSTGQSVSEVAVTYSKINSTLIAGFTQTDKNGYFQLDIPMAEDSILLSFMHMGFAEKRVRLKNETGNHSFKLSQQSRVLSTVVVSSPPIYQRHDTVTYNTDAFSSKEDRVIADIIKKLPGIEMEGDRILYQGKPIQKYFINGLDLLESRYGIANNNLPVEAVKNIQIIENDQPVKILDSLVFSDRASLNIQLKKLTTTGTAKIGAGLQPALWDVNVTPMTFSKNFQTISSFQSNNVGDNVSRQLNALTSGAAFDMTNQADLTRTPTAFLHIQEVAAPSFHEKRWLDNHVNLFTGNFLQKLKNSYELKGRVSYIHDYQRRNGEMHTVLFASDPFIDLHETVNNTSGVHDLSGDVSIIKNDRDLYLKNNLGISQKWISDRGRVSGNTVGMVDQQKRLQDINLYNRLTAVKKAGKQLVSIHSAVGLSQTPQSLTIAPGLFENILHDSLPYTEVRQDVQYRNLTADTYVSFVKGVKQFSLIPKIGILLQRETLENQLSLQSGGDTKTLGNDFTNSLHFFTTEAYLDLKTQYKNRRWRVEVSLPLKLRRYLIRDKVRMTDNPLGALTLEPRGLALYSFNEYWEFRASSAYSQQFGSITTLYNAYLLTSFRNLQRFNAALPRTNSWNNGVSLGYKNLYDALYANLNYSYSLQKRDYIYRNSVDQAGFNTIEMVYQRNAQTRQAIEGDVSKFLEGIKSVIKVSGGVNFHNADYLINDGLEELETAGYTGGFSMHNTSIKHLSVTYETRISFIRSTLSGKRLNDISISNHLLGLNVFPKENHTVSLNADYYLTNLETREDQLFVDLEYLVKVPKWRMEIGMSCLNILDNTTYARMYNTGFSMISNSYELRPRQVLLTARVSFR